MMQRMMFGFAILGGVVFGQFRENTTPSLGCDGQWGRDANRICEMREQRMPVSQKLDIVASPNGGIEVKGWSRNEIWVRARLEAGSKVSGAMAKDLMAQVRMSASAGRVEASGPDSSRDGWWSMSFEVFVPHRIDISAKTVNGGVVAQDLQGRLDYSTVNGGVTLARLAGEVKGRTVNGGVTVDLEGTRWEGAGLDVATTNGGITLSAPAGYAANMEVGTLNGGLSSDFEIPFKGEMGRRKDLSFTLGGGGAPIKVRTVNGGVRVKRKGGAA